MEDDSLSEYHYFYNLFEYVLYTEIFKPTKDLRPMNFDFGFLYYLYGNLLVEVGRLDEALDSLNKSIKINPVNVKSLFESSEVYKLQGKLDEFFKITNDCLKYSYTYEDLGRCYRNLGYYYVEKKEYDIAIAVLSFSLHMDNTSQLVQNELFFISQTLDKKIDILSIEDIEEIFNENNIQMGVNRLILEIAFGLGNDAKVHKDYDTARVCFGIFYNFTGDENIKKLLDELPNSNEE
jgi:tetratricopeptide (TPR) repeat protein